MTSKKSWKQLEEEFDEVPEEPDPELETAPEPVAGALPGQGGAAQTDLRAASAGRPRRDQTTSPRRQGAGEPRRAEDPDPAEQKGTGPCSWSRPSRSLRGRSEGGRGGDRPSRFPASSFSWRRAPRSVKVSNCQ